MEHACVWLLFDLLECIRCARLRVREPGLLPALRPSSIDRHIFPVQFCCARRIYKMRWKRRINTRTPMAYTQAENGLFLFGICRRSCKQSLDISLDISCPIFLALICGMSKIIGCIYVREYELFIFEWFIYIGGREPYRCTDSKDFPQTLNI